MVVIVVSRAASVRLSNRRAAASLPAGRGNAPNLSATHTRRSSRQRRCSGPPPLPPYWPPTPPPRSRPRSPRGLRRWQRPRPIVARQPERPSSSRSVAHTTATTPLTNRANDRWKPQLLPTRATDARPHMGGMTYPFSGLAASLLSSVPQCHYQRCVEHHRVEQVSRFAPLNGQDRGG